MDVNKEVDGLDRAVKCGDEDKAVNIDTKLAVYEHQIKDSLAAMPKEHSETMGFYFRDWFMNLVDEIVFIAMIVLSFRIENYILAILLGGAGAFFLLGAFLSRRKYASFYVKDVWRMRNEKVLANDFKLQLNYIRQSRAEHADFLEKARANTMGDDDPSVFISQLFGGKYPDDKEIINEDERQEDSDPPEK